MSLKSFLCSAAVMRIRGWIAAVRRKIDPFYILHWRKVRRELIEKNHPYENGDESVYRPPIMGLEETLRYIIDTKCSVSRFGDGEFELVVGRDMLFEAANAKMRERLIEILQNPIRGCLTCILNCYRSLDRYVARDLWFWRNFAVWSREGVFPYLAEVYKTNPPKATFGDPQISRPYMVMSDKASAPRIFALWKELVKDQNLLIVEGRFSRLGVGNDLLAGAKSIRRIWCPPKGAFGKYDEILAAIRNEVQEGDIIFLALGATATILAYDLAKLGYRAIDAGHVDVEYMWMKMGAQEKVVIPGRYVSEVAGGQEKKVVAGEEEEYNVVLTIGR